MTKLSIPTLRFISLHPDAALPEANGADAMALDLRAVQDYAIQPRSYALVNFGIVLSPASRLHTCGQQLSLRSGFAATSRCVLQNGVGLIERSFVGFIHGARLQGISAALHSTGSAVDVRVSEGDRVAQLLVYSSDGRVLLPGRDFDVAWDESYCRDGVPFVHKQDWEQRLGPAAGGRGGFGSTGVS